MTFRTPRFGSHALSAGGPLDEAQLRRLVPSAFAVEKHESRSDRYAYIPTADVIQALGREGFAPVAARQGRSRIPGKADFTKHMLRFRHPDASARAVGDTVPEVILINSHDGTSSYQIMAGLFRLVCCNGMVVADSMVDTVRVGHSGNIADKVIEGTYRVIEGSVQALEAPRQWSGVDLSRGEQAAFAEAVHELRFSDASQTLREGIRPEALIAPRRHEDVGSDLWRTFNRAQENAIRGGLSGRARDASNRMRNVSTRPVASIDGDVKLNRALWVLAERMAELKA